MQRTVRTWQDHTAAVRLSRPLRKGAALLETALWIPLLVLLFMGTVELGRVTYTYYSLQKILHGLARELSIQQSVNFCDPADPSILAAKQAAVYGIGVGTGEMITPVVQGLDMGMIHVRVQRYSSQTGNLSDCDCTATAGGCNAGAGARGPDFLVVEIPDGYPVRMRIPGLSSDPISLRPHVLVPYSGL